MFGTPNEIVNPILGQHLMFFYHTNCHNDTRVALDTYIKLKLMIQVFFCMMWRHTMTRYCGQKRKDNTSSHGVRAYPWISSKKYWTVCPFVRVFVCAFVPMVHSGSVNSVNLFNFFTRYLLIFFVAYPIFQHPLLFPSLHTHDFSKYWIPTYVQ